MKDTIQKITLSEEDFEPVCDCPDTPADAALLGAVEINGVYFHVEGIAVREVDLEDPAGGTLYGAWRAIDPCREDKLSALYHCDEADGNMRRVKIAGYEHEYILLITPFYD